MIEWALPKASLDKSLLTQTEIREFLARCNLEHHADLVGRTQTYLGLLAKWNARTNLTGVQAPSEILKVLLAESFFAATFVPEPSGLILDVGSGAGFPGLAMAVYRPELNLVLLEPRQKRMAFLRAVQRELGLPQVLICNRRLEECAVSHFPEPPRMLTMRALQPTPEMLEHGFRVLDDSAKVLLFSSVHAAKATMENLNSLNRICWSEPVIVPWNREHVILLGGLRRCST